jgi:hypothetical protein
MACVALVLSLVQSEDPLIRYEPTSPRQFLPSSGHDLHGRIWGRRVADLENEAPL